MSWRLLTGIILSMLLVLVLARFAVGWVQCSWYSYETSREARYSPFLGCLVQTPTGWVPRNEMRSVQ